MAVFGEPLLGITHNLEATKDEAMVWCGLSLVSKSIDDYGFAHEICIEPTVIDELDSEQYSGCKYE